MIFLEFSMDCKTLCRLALKFEIITIAYRTAGAAVMVMGYSGFG
jgi:hypothetical protein